MNPPIYSKKAAKILNNMDRPTQQRIKAGIEKIPDGDIAPLKGSDDDFRLRIGDWRIIFAYVDSSTIMVKKIAPRGEVYKGV
jgi:mRNA interferase RelE/StbE